ARRTAGQLQGLTGTIGRTCEAGRVHGAPTCPRGLASIMQDHSGAKAAAHASLGRRLAGYVFRAGVIASASCAATFGFLSASANPARPYDAHLFSTGIAALFGAACGSIGLLLGRLRLIRIEMHDLDDSFEKVSDLNWELKEAQERAKSFLQAQGDAVMRRDVDGYLTFVNDAYCA